VARQIPGFSPIPRFDEDRLVSEIDFAYSEDDPVDADPEARPRIRRERRVLHRFDEEVVFLRRNP
jgi:hypothetical protein